MCETGGPIGPLLFNLAVGSLVAILDKDRMSIHISGVVGHLIPGDGFTHLQYADDTMVIVEGFDHDIISLKFFAFLRSCLVLRSTYTRGGGFRVL